MGRIPIKRQTQPEEVAYACAFLCSEPAFAITGSQIHLDGGLNMIG
jgi:enoyl-[acyl-carrier-protein] reductase (NADH)